MGYKFIGYVYLRYKFIWGLVLLRRFVITSVNLRLTCNAHTFSLCNIQSYVGGIGDMDNVLSRHTLDSGVNWNKSGTPELDSDESRSRFALLRQAICGEPFAERRQAIRPAANCFYRWLKFTSVRSVVNLIP